AAGLDGAARVRDPLLRVADGELLGPLLLAVAHPDVLDLRVRRAGDLGPDPDRVLHGELGRLAHRLALLHALGPLGGHADVGPRAAAQQKSNDHEHFSHGVPLCPVNERPSARPNSATSSGLTSATVTGRPRSCATEVMTAASKPHGLMRPK